MDQVIIKNEEVDGVAVVSRRAFTKVWAGKGWTEMTPENSSPEDYKAAADKVGVLLPEGEALTPEAIESALSDHVAAREAAADEASSSTTTTPSTRGGEA